jgi:hypothetical protein
MQGAHHRELDREHLPLLTIRIVTGSTVQIAASQLVFALAN